jgi:cytochrome c oxidase cbb3-type subunit 3
MSIVSESRRRLRLDLQDRRLWAGAAVVLLLVLVAGWQIRQHTLDARLLRAAPDAILSDPGLTRYAVSIAKPAFAHECARCHGKDMKGSHAKGTPDLTDNIWLYDTGEVAEIERTVLFGIRSPNRKAHNVTDMPGLGRMGQITAGDTRDVMAYLDKIEGKTPLADPATLERGFKIWNDKGSCYDCHADDGKGVSAYGAPDLTDKEWIFGGDKKAIFDSIVHGRHGVCPAFIDELRPAVIRGLAVYIKAASQKTVAASGAPASGAKS